MDILMPQLGETVAEGKVVKWFKAVGDAVEAGDNLFEIETDKTSMEVPATMAGVLTEVRVGEGAVVPVGAVVAILTGEGETASAASAPAPVQPQPPLIRAQAGIQNQTTQTVQASLDSRLRGNERSAAVTVESAPSARSSTPLDPWQAVRTPDRNYGPARLPGGTVVTPLARRLAAEAGIDLGALSPSGPHGRIVARDVETAVPHTPLMPANAGIQNLGPRFRGDERHSVDRIKSMFEAGSFEEVPLGAMRKTIAERLVEAKQTIPHFYLARDVSVERIKAVRAEVNADRAQDGIKISINDFVIKALALALQRVPAANAVFAEDRILRFKGADIGVAVSVDGGLVTPVIRNAHVKNIGEISTEMKDFADRARTRKLRPHEIVGGVTAVSNLCMYGVREFSAIINPPHATILAVGAAQRRPVEEANGSVRFAEQMTVTLSCDHRVVDGALGAQLLEAFTLFIEHPVGMMV